MKKITGRTVAFLLVLLLALLPLVACGKNTGEGKELRFPLWATPSNLDPAIANGREENLILANCFEGLVRLHANGESDAEDGADPIAPGVAQRWEISADGLRYTFHLRQDTHWRLPAEAKALLGEAAYAAFDTTVTAADFLFAFRRVLDPETNAPNAALLFPIANARAIWEGKKSAEALGVAVTDPFTLEITLAQPNAAFLYSLCQNPAMPCNEAYFNATKGRYGLAPRYLLCNGAFYLSAWDATTLRLKRNDGYLGAEPVSPSAVVLKLETNAAERLRLLGAEGGFSAVLLPANQPGALETGTHSIPLKSATQALLFRCTGARALAVAKLRRALCAAIDPAALGLSAAPPGLLPDSLRLGDGTYRALAGAATGIAHDNAAAQTLWAQGLAEWEAAGGATPVTLTLLCPEEANRQMRLLLMQWQVAFPLSLVVTVESPEPEKLAQRLAQGEYDIALSTLQAGSSFALATLEQLAESGADNLTGYRSAALEKLLAEAAQTAGQKEAAAALRKAEEHLLQVGAYYPLAAQESLLLLANGVSGLTVSAAGDVVYFGQGLAK
ncbi:MAG: peptide ABC transporter substrate-binding protein [Oscillospiraceae bacterium]|nr:peptide ABC transporter substrate-binding protein [Oscillospiraceae bacterium]